MNKVVIWNLEFALNDVPEIVKQNNWKKKCIRKYRISKYDDGSIFLSDKYNKENREIDITDIPEAYLADVPKLLDKYAEAKSFVLKDDLLHLVKCCKSIPNFYFETVKSYDDDRVEYIAKKELLNIFQGCLPEGKLTPRNVRDAYGFSKFVKLKDTEKKIPGESVFVLTNGQFLVDESGDNESGLWYITAADDFDYKNFSKTTLNIKLLGNVEFRKGKYYKSKKGKNIFKISKDGEHYLLRGKNFIEQLNEVALYKRQTSVYEYLIIKAGTYFPLFEEDL